MLNLKPVTSYEERREAAIDAYASAAGKAAAVALARGTTTPGELMELARSGRTTARFHNMMVGVAPSSNRPTEKKSKR